jgi:hypothetical protein
MYSVASLLTYNFIILRQLFSASKLKEVDSPERDKIEVDQLYPFHISPAFLSQQLARNHVSIRVMSYKAHRDINFRHKSSTFHQCLDLRLAIEIVAISFQVSAVVVDASQLQDLKLTG